MRNNNFEDRFLSGIDNSIKKKKEDNLFDTTLLNKLRDRFEERYGKTRPLMKEFVDIYGAEEIMRDREHLKKIQENFKYNNQTENEKRLVAEVFECIFIEEAMKSAWIGREARVTPTNNFDDTVNKVDAVAEIKGKEGFQELGLAIDVTFSKEDSELIKKMDYIKRNIDEGKSPAMIKYFKDRNGKLKKIYVPKVIIGCETETLRQLIDLMNKKASSNEITWKKAEHELNFHYFQTILLNEIFTQVKYFSNYAHKIGQKRTGDSYYKAQKIIEEVIKSKALYKEQLDQKEVKDDYIMETITNYCKY